MKEKARQSNVRHVLIHKRILNCLGKITNPGFATLTLQRPASRTGRSIGLGKQNLIAKFTKIRESIIFFLESVSNLSHERREQWQKD